MTFKQECPICGRITSVYIRDEEYMAYRYNIPIDESVITKDTFAVRCLSTGLCYECQEKELNHPVPFNKAAWGDCIGQCAVCQCTLYEKLDKRNNVYRCPRCKSTYVKIDNKLCHTTSWL